MLAPLLGTWAGRGAGEYPTIEPFGYLEEVTFGHVGKPFLTYRQRTRADDDGRPLHAETGYIRVPSAGRVELVLAHPTGITEVDEGTLSVQGTTVEMELVATTIGRTASAKEVTALGRSIRVDGDVLTYTLHMGAVGQPLQHHLTATLHRKQGMTHRTAESAFRPTSTRSQLSAPRITPTSTRRRSSGSGRRPGIGMRRECTRRSSCACGTTGRWS